MSSTWVTLMLFLFVMHANVIIYKLARANISIELNFTFLSDDLEFYKVNHSPRDDILDLSLSTYLFGFSCRPRSLFRGMHERWMLGSDRQSVLLLHESSAQKTLYRIVPVGARIVRVGSEGMPEMPSGMFQCLHWSCKWWCHYYNAARLDSNMWAHSKVIFNHSWKGPLFSQKQGIGTEFPFLTLKFELPRKSENLVFFAVENYISFRIINGHFLHNPSINCKHQFSFHSMIILVALCTPWLSMFMNWIPVVHLFYLISSTSYIILNMWGKRPT